MSDEALLAGLNNLHSAFVAHQANSERRWQAVDRKMDRLYAKLSDVCDRGGAEHDGFSQKLHELDLRITAQEQRNAGRADVLKPALAWAGKNLGYVLLAAYVGWTQFVVPMIATATAQPVQIHGRF